MFQVDSGKVFKEDVDIVPTIIDETLSYIPWGSDNNMPYHITDRREQQISARPVWCVFSKLTVFLYFSIFCRIPNRINRK